MASAELQQAVQHGEAMITRMMSAAAEGNIVEALRAAMDAAYQFDVSDAATVRPVESRPRWASESSIPSSSRPIGAGLPRDALLCTIPPIPHMAAQI